MSAERAIWNDGQGLATPDLQRGCNDAGAADDRAHEVYLTPGAVQKKVMPLLDETATQIPQYLAIPSAAGLTPAGVNGAVRLLACELVAGSPSNTQAIALAGNLQAPLDTVAITSNSSGSTRYDLIYATLNRAVTVSGTRKIKSATDGSLSSQTVNLADAPTITLGVNVGFLTGATPPTTAQINAATPADTAPSSSTFGSFNFPIAYVTVANGYSSGTVLFQNSSGGSTYLTQCWAGGFIRRHRVESYRAATLIGSGIAEAPKSVAVTTRTGAAISIKSPVYVLPATKLVGTDNLSTWPVLDNSIDWRYRIISATVTYLTSAASSATPESLLSASSGGLSDRKSVV